MPRTKGSKNKIQKPKTTLEKFCYSYIYAGKFINDIVQGGRDQSSISLSRLLEMLVLENTTTRQIDENTYEHTLTLRRKVVAKVVNELPTAPKMKWHTRHKNQLANYTRNQYTDKI